MRSQCRMLLVLFCLPVLLTAQNLKEFEKRVTEFTLTNGLHFIILERHEAPVVSFHTYVNAGSVDDPGGKTGLAHMFEHMAFKGTETIGTKNYTEEKKALEALERAYDQLEAEQARRGLRQGAPAANGGEPVTSGNGHASLPLEAGAKKLQALEEQVKAETAKAESYVIPNAYPQFIEENGGVGLNANTAEDSTNYYYSLPANRIELWFLLESQRFLHPVFREFYKERDVVREERRMRVDSNPEGKLMEALQATAFEAHPYRDTAIGWPSDIAHLRVGDAEEFFHKYYVPPNITIAIAGDVNPLEAKRLAQKYFSLLPARPLPEPLHTVEPPQEGPKRVAIETPSQPFLAMVYKRPDQRSADDPVLEVLSGVLGDGRTGLLYTSLVRDRKIALEVDTAPAYPAGEYPNLFLIFVAPSQGHEVEENEKAVNEVIERLKREKVDAETLARVKTKVRAALIRQLDSNTGMAEELAFYHVNYGDWQKMFTGLDDINRVTADDVQRVVRQYFVEGGRTVAYAVALPEPAAMDKGGVVRLTASRRDGAVLRNTALSSGAGKRGAE